MRLSEKIFQEKYAQPECETWEKLADSLVEKIWRGNPQQEEMKYIIREKKFIPGGRYLRNAGKNRPAYYTNCYGFRAEDTREGWAELLHDTTLASMCGGGVGVDYSDIRPEGSLLRRTGGIASGPLSLVRMIEMVGKNVVQGGYRRTAILASIRATHPDAEKFLMLKEQDKSIDHTNTTIWYGSPEELELPIFQKHLRISIKSGCPGFAFNFQNPNECIRNACGEMTTDEDGDYCSLGSLNLANIGSIQELGGVAKLAYQFLLYGTLSAEYALGKTEKLVEKRSIQQRVGLGLMGVAEWFATRNLPYGYIPEKKSRIASEREKDFEEWLKMYRDIQPSYLLRGRAVAPTGTISWIAETSSGIEPIYSHYYEKIWLAHGEWQKEIVLDPVSEKLQRKGFSLENIETASTIPVERRIAFQAKVQEYVDQGISSTVNLFGKYEDVDFEKIEKLLKEYAPKLRGITFYLDGAKEGQPIRPVEKPVDVCDLRGGSCE